MPSKMSARRRGGYSSSTRPAKFTTDSSPRRASLCLPARAKSRRRREPPIFHASWKSVAATVSNSSCRISSARSPKPSWPLTRYAGSRYAELGERSRVVSERLPAAELGQAPDRREGSNTIRSRLGSADRERCLGVSLPVDLDAGADAPSRLPGLLTTMPMASLSIRSKDSPSGCDALPTGLHRRYADRGYHQGQDACRSPVVPLHPGAMRFTGLPALSPDASARMKSARRCRRT